MICHIKRSKVVILDNSEICSSFSSNHLVHLHFATSCSGGSARTSSESSLYDYLLHDCSDFGVIAQEIGYAGHVTQF